MKSTKSTSHVLSAASKRPLLPDSIIEENKKQPAFFDSYALASIRLHMLKTSLSKDMLAPNLDVHHHWSGFGFDEATGRGVLHLAATVGDVLFTHELLYLGLDPDFADNQGVTPLFMALYTAAQVVDPRVVTKTPKYWTYWISKAELAVPNAPKQILQRQSRIVRALIEQHANVNQTHHGLSLLELACRARDWRNVSLLLEHGADPKVITPARLQECLATNDERKLFLQFAERKALPQSAERPPRKCPCWSGKALDECHRVPGARIPYPSEYVCFCGTQKVNDKCCGTGKKRVDIFTSWDERTQRITTYTDTAVSQSDSYRTALRRIQALDFPEFRDPNKPVVLKEISGDSLPFSDLDMDTLQRFREEMVRLNKVDPAFAFGMTRVRFPLPANRESALKHMRKSYQLTWNAAIDEYINSGVDPRPKAEIERQAKVGTWGGAFIRQCESVECTKLETDPGIVKMMQCSGCQITVYCSRQCQKSHWPIHKSECGKKEQSPQLLPSQHAIREYLAEKIRSTPDIAIPLGLMPKEGEETELP